MLQETLAPWLGRRGAAGSPLSSLGQKSASSLRLMPVALPSAPNVGAQHPANESNARFCLSRYLFPLPCAHRGGPHGFCWGGHPRPAPGPPQPPQLLGSGVGKGRFSNEFRFNLQVKKFVFFCSLCCSPNV